MKGPLQRQFRQWTKEEVQMKKIKKMVVKHGPLVIMLLAVASAACIVWGCFHPNAVNGAASTLIALIQNHRELSFWVGIIGITLILYRIIACITRRIENDEGN